MDPARHRSPSMQALAVKPCDWNLQVSAHNRRVIVALLARGHSLADAKDIAQDAWARVYEKWEAGKLRRLELPGLVIRQALFLGADARRAARRRPVVELDELRREATKETTADAKLLATEELGRAREAFESCSPRAQEIFLAAYANDEPHRVVAKRLGISVQRLRQSLCEVRDKLRRALEESDE